MGYGTYSCIYVYLSVHVFHTSMCTNTMYIRILTISYNCVYAYMFLYS